MTPMSLYLNLAPSRTVTTPTRYTYNYKVHLHLQGTLAPARYRFTYIRSNKFTSDVKLHLKGTGVLTKYSWTYGVQLHLRA
jgi:hypothetical protein